MTNFKLIFYNSIRRHFTTNVTSNVTTNKRYTSKELLNVESKWKQVWKVVPQQYTQQKDGNSKYILSMMPYPSGKLHMGHVRVYTISDALARYQKMRGHNVLHPMSWDAFGLPAENAAIERNTRPDIWTRENISQMRDQMDSLSLNFDWDKQIATCDPEYYKWTQWIFIKLYQKGLAYRKEATVNWDPVDLTVLADEQVDVNGKSWRSGAIVEKKSLMQWYLKITHYQQDLLDGLKELDEWPKAVKDMQRNWIVDIKSCKCKFTVQIVDSSNGMYLEETSLTLDDPKDWLKIDHFLSKEYLNCHIINPCTLEQEPIKFDKDALEITPILIDPKVQPLKKAKISPTEVPQELIIEKYRLRDWLISRQRYWGTPIPIIHCEKCGTVPVPEGDLPVVLPLDVEFSGKGGSPLSKLEDWVNTKCPSCNNEAKRETDTMDTFMDSSWYFLRNTDPLNKDQIADPKVIAERLPVSVYIGGIEHAILHLMYARFIHRFILQELGLPPTEPFAALITQGLVEGKTYKCPSTGRYLKPDEITHDMTPVWEKMSKSKHNGLDPVDLVGSFGADVLRLCVLFKAPPEVPLRWNTDEIAGPLRWLVRILNLASRIKNDFIVNINDDVDSKESSLLDEAVNKCIGDMEFAYDPINHRLNLTVSNLMKFSNSIEEHYSNSTIKSRMNAIRTLALLLHPIAPHTSAEILEIIGIGEDNSNITLEWPKKYIK